MYGLDLGSIPNRSTRVLIGSLVDIILLISWLLIVEHEITICPDFEALRGQQVIYDILLTGIINELMAEMPPF